MNNISDTLREMGIAIDTDVPMHTCVTFRTGGNAALVVSPESEEQLAAAYKLLSKENCFILGNGSNILIPDEGLTRPVIRLADNFSGITKTGETSFRVLAGTKLITVCNYAYENGLTGLEFAYGIPGSAGGAVFMNAGAYDGEIKDVVSAVRAIGTDGTIKTLTSDELAFSYRYSVFQTEPYLIVSADFNLSKSDKVDIKAKMDDFIGRRKSKQPLEYPSAGSAFKRPEGAYAGKLIQDCGLAGYRIGGAEVSSKHCGFIINKDNATSNDILELIGYVSKVVLEKTGFRLEPEVRLIH